MIKSNQGENLSREWRGDPLASEVWDALQVAKNDPARGVASLEALSDGGSALSMMHLGDMLMRGQFGVAQDINRGELLLRRSSALGSIEGKYRLAKHLWFQGRWREAVSLYEDLAEIGFSPALFSLGVIFYEGIGVEKDREKSFGFFKSAVSKGHLYAAHWLSIILMKENKGAFSWCKGLWVRVKNIVPFVRYNAYYPNSDRLRR